MTVKDKKIVKFKCIPYRCTFDNKKDFKIYACDDIYSKEYKIKKNSYGNYTISGNLHDLGIGIEYEVEAIEKYNPTYKYSYEIVSINRDIPTDEHSTRLFLNEILTSSQADVLMKVYPDIVDRVIKNKLSDIDLSKTKGIKEYTFGVIKRKIMENFILSKMFKEFDGLISFDVLKRLSDKYPSAQKIKEELSKNPYKCLCSLSRIAFKTADSILLEIEKESQKLKSKGLEPKLNFGENLISSEMRMHACIMYLLKENENNGNTRMSLKKLKSECVKMTPKCINHFTYSIKNSDDLKISKDGYISSLSIYEKEAYICSKILNGIDIKNEWNFEIEKYKKDSNSELTDEQFGLLEDFRKNNIHILSGFGGTGKSYTVGKLIQMLDDNHKSYTLCSPTGRASKVLSKYTGRNASTVHRMLMYNPKEGWGLNYKNKIYEDVVIMDEASMSDTELFYRLVDAIDFSRTKLLIVGDPAQLPSVGCGNVLHDLINSEIVPVTQLTKVFRYGIGGLSTIATDIRNMKDYIPKNISKPMIFGKDKGFTFIPSAKQNVIKNCISVYKKLLDKGYTPEDIMVLSAFNKGDYGTVKLNKYLQNIANSKNINKNNIKIGDNVFYLEDLIIQKKNNYKAELFTNYEKREENYPKTFIPNGDIGVINEIYKNNQSKIKFDNDTRYFRDDFQDVKLAYSISIHSSQGGQAKIVILLSPSSHQIMLSSNLLYVGVTRAEEKCIQIGEPQACLKAIKKKENFKRITNMSELIKNKKLCDLEYEKFVSKYHNFLDEEKYS